MAVNATGLRLLQQNSRCKGERNVTNLLGDYVEKWYISVITSYM